MKQEIVIRQTQDAAIRVLRQLEALEKIRFHKKRDEHFHKPDTNSLDKWTEALTRYVLIGPDHYTAAVGLEKLNRQICVQCINLMENRDPTLALASIKQYLEALYQACRHVEEAEWTDIQFEPTLDGATYPPPAGTN